MPPTFTNAEIKQLALNVLAMLGVHGVPRSIRLDVTMLRLLIAIPVDDPQQATACARAMRDEVRLVISQAMLTSRGAVYCTDEQAIVRYLQEIVGIDLGVDMTGWQQPRDRDLREFITDLGGSIFFQLGRLV